MKMGEKNVGTADRIARILIGLILIYLGATMVSAILMYAVVIIGIIILLTGIFATCTLYTLLGMNTLGKKA